MHLSLNIIRFSSFHTPSSGTNILIPQIQPLLVNTGICLPKWSETDLVILGSVGYDKFLKDSILEEKIKRNILTSS